MANNSVTYVEISFIQNATCLVAVGSLAWYMGLSFRKDVPYESVPTLCISSIAMTVMQVFVNLMVLSLPLTVNYAFWAIVPFTIAIMVRLTIDETISNATIVAMVLSFGAMVYMALFDRGDNGQSEKLNY